MTRKCYQCRHVYGDFEPACPVCGAAYSEPKTRDANSDRIECERIDRETREREERLREQRWIARGSPTAAHSREKIEKLMHQPPMTNLERAHLILSRGNCGLIAEEWAREYVANHDKTPS